MEVRILNGLSRVTPDVDMYMNGLSRVNHILDGYSLNAYSLNGYTLNADEIDDVEDYCLECQRINVVPTLNGYLNGRAERKARRAARKKRREEKRAAKSRRTEAKTRRKELRAERKERRLARKDRRLDIKEQKQQAKLARQEEREERKAKRREMSQDVLTKAADIGQSLIAQKVGDVVPTEEIFVDEYADETTGSEKGLFGPPKLFEDPAKWFKSSRVPTWQKVGVVAGAALVADQLLNKGAFTAQLTGKKKRK